MVAYIIHNQINQVFKGRFLEKYDFQIQFSVSKIDDIFLIFFLLMVNPLDGRNTKKLKNQKPKLLIFL